MTARRLSEGSRRVGALMLVVASLVACGKKGPPLPPLRPMPGRVVDLTARRAADQVTLRFTVPAANADSTTPPAAGRIDIYRVVAATGDPRPPGSALVTADNLVGSLDLALGGTAPEPEGAAARPAPGAMATWVDRIGPDASATGASSTLWRYVVVAVAGRDRRGSQSNLVEVPLGETVDAVSGLAIAYDAETVQLSWSAGQEGAVFEVVELDRAGSAAPRLLTPDPISDPAFQAPVEFGRDRCYAVRAVLVEGATTVDGALSEPQCAAPVDTFPPLPPDGLVAVQEGAVVVLRWRASAASDLGGYVVLRGDDAGETLRPLVTTLLTATSYRDESVQAGRTYVYVVVAVDQSTPANTSGQSNRETVIVR